MTTITISRQYGSGGDEIAQRVCEALNYQIFSKDLIEQVAAEAGLSEQDIATISTEVSEETYKIRSFFEKMMDNMAIASARMMFPDALPTIPADQPIRLSEEATFALVQKAIETGYRSGNIIIVGRGGQAFLMDRPNVLHVRIVAPRKERIQRIKEQIALSRKPGRPPVDERRMAQNLINRRDTASAAYIQHFYHADWDDPLLYDLVINTGRTSIDQAVALIVQMNAWQQAQDQPVSVEGQSA